MAQDQRDVIEVLTHDHAEVEQMFTQLQTLRGVTGEGAQSQRKDLVDQVTIELVRHSVAEEAEVYPRVAAKISDAEAEHAEHEHAEAEEIMKRLEKLQPDDPTFDDELAALMQGVREHLAEEGGADVPSHARGLLPRKSLSSSGPGSRP